MSLPSLMLAPAAQVKRVSDRESAACVRGCTELIVCPDCPTHGFPVTRTRARFVGTEAWITGEVSLLDAIRFMRFLRIGQDDVKPKDRIRPESVEFVDVATGRVIPLPD